MGALLSVVIDHREVAAARRATPTVSASRAPAVANGTR
jgi:hypothetical protein